MKGERVLVTGSAGVIGLELLKLLSAGGAVVLSVDRLPLTAKPAGVEHRQADLALDEVGFLWDFRPRIIFHLAATFERADETADFWSPNWYDNVVVSHRLADGARKARGTEVLVFASSYLTYDPSLYLADSPHAAVALGESARLSPRNLCGAAKLYAEKEYEFAANLLHGPPRIAAARIFRVYGRGSRDVISRWVRAALNGEPLTVYQRENAFDYIFASDVAEALLRIAVSNQAHGAINVGTGIAKSIQNVLDALAECLPAVGLKIRDESRSDRFEASAANIERLVELTGWAPGIGLSDGIRAIIAHEAQQRAET